MPGRSPTLDGSLTAICMQLWWTGHWIAYDDDPDCQIDAGGSVRRDDPSDRQLWKAYIQLTQAEAAFRIQKEQLTVRPVWHQREYRVQAHILVCFLAFVL